MQNSQVTLYCTVLYCICITSSVTFNNYSKSLHSQKLKSSQVHMYYPTTWSFPRQVLNCHNFSFRHMKKKKKKSFRHMLLFFIRAHCVQPVCFSVVKNHKINHVHLGLMIPSSRGVGSAVSPANKHSFSVIQHMPATNVSSVPTLPSVDVTVLWVFFLLILSHGWLFCIQSRARFTTHFRIMYLTPTNMHGITILLNTYNVECLYMRSSFLVQLCCLLPSVPSAF